MYQYRIKTIHKVIDGDTVDVDIDLGFGIFLRQKVRLVDINAPELRSLNEDVKRYALRAKGKLEEYISREGELIVNTLKPNSTDKYGRILGTLYKEGRGLTASEFMLANRYAWYYDPKITQSDLSKLAPLEE
jgi:micrococcal nuclease